MKELFLSECRRFRKLALVATAVHLAIQLLASRLIEPLQSGVTEQAAFAAACALAGLAFAAVQFSSYRQPSRWLWLMHRPLPRPHIFGALALASLALLLVAIGLPALLAVVGTDRLSGRTVDARHYVIPVYLTLTSFIAWLGATYLMLCGRRGAFVVLFVPVLLVAHVAPGAALLPLVVLCAVLMAALAYTAVKPDRTAPPSSPGGLLAAGVPLVLGFHFMMLWGGSVAFQCAQMLGGVHPLNSDVPPAGGYTELVRTDGRGNLQRALAASNDPRAAQWRRQLALLDVGLVQPETRDHVVRGQIANLGMTTFKETDKGIAWTFSHDRMLYEGRDVNTGAPRGWFGRGGRNELQPFDTLPVLAGRALLTKQHLIQPDLDTGRNRTLVEVRAPETLASGLQEVGRQLFVLTNQRLIAYRKPAAPDAAPQELYSVALPGPFGDLARVDVARLLDGTLLSFDFGRRMVDGGSGSRQHLLFVDAAGQAQTLSTRVLVHDFPQLFEHRDWWPSPLLHAVAGLPERLLDKGAIADLPAPARSPARPAGVIAAALLAALLSAALAAWRLRRQPLPRRLAWSAAALVLGPPCTAALWVLAPRVPLPAPANARLPVTAAA